MYAMYANGSTFVYYKLLLWLMNLATWQLATNTFCPILMMTFFICFLKKKDNKMMSQVKLDLNLTFKVIRKYN